ncbi:hypothetical protein BDR26DRAFT_916574 [Obelidium mucronatum]|nr:hypothetical protein BDR26DRAFT_916574 [Obelidium mucronatum]
MAALNCVVTLPPNALSVKGLSTPWTVTGCDQTVNPRFAECTIVDLATGALSVYSPLLVNKGAKPGVNFIPPTVPTLPAKSAIGCWFGTNGMTTALTDNNNGADVRAANCIGINGRAIFGQFAACNAKQFFAAANPIVQIPPLATGNNGLPCYTTRSFQIIDMDPSDNVVTSYLMGGANNKLAQKTVKNKVALKGAQEITNGSDNLLLDASYRPAIGCSPFTARNLADPTGPFVGSLALNEFQAKKLQGKVQALIPPTDPFVQINGAPNINKQNMYRAAVNQPPATGSAAETLAFCQGMLNITAPGFITDIKFLVGQTSPDPANGKDLFTFLGQRFEASWTGLTCNTVIPLVGANGKSIQSPITANRNAAGVTQSLTFNTPALIALLKKNGGPTAEAQVLAPAPAAKKVKAKAAKKAGVAAGAAAKTPTKKPVSNQK